MDVVPKIRSIIADILRWRIEVELHRENVINFRYFVHKNDRNSCVACETLKLAKPLTRKIFELQMALVNMELIKDGLE